MAPTRATADNIDGNTYHTALECCLFGIDEATPFRSGFNNDCGQEQLQNIFGINVETWLFINIWGIAISIKFFLFKAYG
jgi:hypothetical protein